jgi:pimeloyl-[acyl-carrier protein] methyl ester esterase
MQARRDFLIGLTAATAGAVTASRARARAAFTSRRITVETRGRGPDLILIPGLASTAAIWRSTADRLAGKYRLHLVSVRGFGDLPAQANADGAVLGAVAGEVLRYITESRLNRPAIIGHSMGGQIGLRVASDWPWAVGRLMTVDSSPFFAALISPQATVRDVQPIAQVAYQAIQFLGDEALQTQGRSVGLELGGATDSLFSGIGWQGGDRQVLAQSLYEVMTIDLRPRLPRITAPVTVVYGWSSDRNSPRGHADSLFRSAYARLPGPAVFERIEGAEHMVMIDQPTRFVAAVDRFMR